MPDSFWFMAPKAPLECGGFPPLYTRVNGSFDCKSGAQAPLLSAQSKNYAALGCQTALGSC
jgi:hypothetical protein